MFLIFNKFCFKFLHGKSCFVPGSFANCLFRHRSKALSHYGLEGRMLFMSMAYHYFFLSFFLFQHNLVCGDALKTSHAQLIFYCGVLVGDLGFGLLSDM